MYKNIVCKCKFEQFVQYWNISYIITVYYYLIILMII